MNFEGRRKEFMRRMESGIAIFKSSSQVNRGGDSDYKYHQDSDFYYLTGCEIPDSIAVLAPNHPEYQYMLFIPIFDKEKEAWIGKQLEIEEAKEKFKADIVYPIDKFEEIILKDLKKTDRILWRFAKDEDLDRKLLKLIKSCRHGRHYNFPGPASIVDPSVIMHEMRLVKSDEEIEMMRKSAQITAESHIATIKMVKPEIFEYEIEAFIEYQFRKRGATGPAYLTIVASGNNATTLHYTANNCKIKEGDLVLIDAGADYFYYCTDVTRTLPADGKFTEEQKTIYKIVLKAEKEAISIVKPGITIDDVHQKALRIIIEGMRDAGLIKGSVDEIIESKDYNKFYMHRTSHWLGMDVHDVGNYRDHKRVLEPGILFSVEPGIYLSNNLEGIPPNYRGIGIRIEDDVLVTPHGFSVLTESVPKEIEEIEDLIKGL